VYDNVSSLTSLGRRGSTKNRTGMRRVSPALSTCSVKQKHSVLLKNADAELGATLGTALPTIACALVFVASNQASTSLPGCTCRLGCSGANVHGSLLLTLATNCTVIVRLVSSVIVASASVPVEPSARRMPSTCWQTMRYTGTIAKPNTKAQATTIAVVFTTRDAQSSAAHLMSAVSTIAST
jgi:hypothetical protein